MERRNQSSSPINLLPTLNSRKMPLTSLEAAFTSACAFLDEEKSVKLYIDFEGIGDKCEDEDIVLEYTSTSLCLVINNYKEEPLCLGFEKLTALIDKAVCKKRRIDLFSCLPQDRRRSLAYNQ
jgi:hypothetical protein